MKVDNIIKVFHHLGINNPFEVIYGYPKGKRDEFFGDTHYDLQIYIQLSGEIEVKYNDFITKIGTGQVYWTSCWEPHATRPVRENYAYVVVTVSPEALGSLFPFHDVEWLAPFFVPPSLRPQAEDIKSRLKIHRLGKEIKALHKNRPEAWKSLIWLKIHELIIFMTDLWQKPESADTRGFGRILPALQYLKDNPDKVISVEEAAAACRLSRSRFSELFTAAAGMSFAKFALRARASEAARLLTSSSLPVKEIASMCGFADLSHFYHVFSKNFTCTPMDYRKRNRENMSQA